MANLLTVFSISCQCLHTLQFLHTVSYNLATEDLWPCKRFLQISIYTSWSCATSVIINWGTDFCVFWLNSLQVSGLQCLACDAFQLSNSRYTVFKLYVLMLIPEVKSWFLFLTNRVWLLAITASDLRFLFVKWLHELNEII